VPRGLLPIDRNAFALRGASLIASDAFALPGPSAFAGNAVALAVFVRVALESSAARL
jgi:hypothetical protein